MGKSLSYTCICTYGDYGTLLAIIQKDGTFQIFGCSNNQNCTDIYLLYVGKTHESPIKHLSNIQINLVTKIISASTSATRITQPHIQQSGESCYRVFTTTSLSLSLSLSLSSLSLSLSLSLSVVLRVIASLLQQKYW